MNLTGILKSYILAQKRNEKTKHELAVAKTKLEMECRRMSNSSDDIINGNLKLIATILLGKIND